MKRRRNNRSKLVRVSVGWSCKHAAKCHPPWILNEVTIISIRSPTNWMKLLENEVPTRGETKDLCVETNIRTECTITIKCIWTDAIEIQEAVTYRYAVKINNVHCVRIKLRSKAICAESVSIKCPNAFFSFIQSAVYLRRALSRREPNGSNLCEIIHNGA